MIRERDKAVWMRAAQRCYSSHSQSARSYDTSSATWHNGAARAATRGSAPPLVLLVEVSPFCAREASPPATARSDNAADRCTRVLGPAARARAWAMSHDCAAAARRICAEALVLWTSLGHALLSGRNVSRRE